MSVINIISIGFSVLLILMVLSLFIAEHRWSKEKEKRDAHLRKLATKWVKEQTKATKR